MLSNPPIVVRFKVTLPVLLGLVGLIFIVGGAVGQMIEPDPEPKVVTEVEYKTKTKTETKIEYKTDPKCAEAGKLALAIGEASSDLNISYSEMLRIMGDLRVAVAMKDSNAANDLETDLRKTDAPLLKAAETLATTRDDLARAVRDCND